MGVKSPKAKELRLILRPQRAGFSMRALLGRKAFFAALTGCLLGLNGIKPEGGGGFHGAGVLAPLKPPPPAMAAGNAKEIPRGSEY